jgi:hypothetical protein
MSESLSQVIYASPTAGAVPVAGGSLDIWELTSGGLVSHNGSADSTTSACLCLWYHNHTIYHSAANGSSFGSPGWWTWNGSVWTAIQCPITETVEGFSVNSVGPIVFASQTAGTAATAGATLDIWTISLAGQVLRNGTADATTAQVIQLYYHNHRVYYESVLGNASGTPGWWSWNGTGWSVSVSPVVVGPALSVGSVVSQVISVAWTITGSIFNYATAPTLQYMDNGSGTWLALPAGSNVNTTSFSFIHPSEATVISNAVVAVRDANATTVTATSNVFQITNPNQVSLNSAALSPLTFSVGTSPITVGTVTIGTTPANKFPGTGGALTLSGTDAAFFAVNSDQATIVTSQTTAARTYSLGVTATLAGAVGSPLGPTTFSIVGSSGPSVGPSVTGNFVNVDFTNLTNPAGGSNITIQPQIFGVSGIGLANNNWAYLSNATFRNLVRALNLPLFRLHSGWSDSQPAASNLSAFATQASAMFPSTCTLIIGSNYTTQAQFKAVSDFWVANGTIPCNYWEVNNEPNLPGNYTAQFAAGSAGYRQTNASFKVGGPVSAGYNPSGFDTGFINANTITSLAYLNFHQYFYCQGQEATPTNAQMCAGNKSTTGNIQTPTYQTLVPTAQGNLNGTYLATAPVFLGEYNNECGASFSDLRAGTSAGAALLVSATMGFASTATRNPAWMGLWDIMDDAGAAYQLIDSSFNVYPQYYTIQRLISSIPTPGTMVGSSSTGTGGSLIAWGVKSGTKFGVAIVNPGGSAVTGQIALSHWPVNSTGNGTAAYWSYPTSSSLGSATATPTGSPVQNTPGTVTSVAVTGGLTASVTVPALSCAILSM